MSTPKKMSKNNRKRFSDDQIKSLEKTFDTESRPELRLKQNLANKLGLQPRQVAIWFQNKRARSKSKQIEREYTVLKTNYDKLASLFENLKKENQALLIQLQRLRKLTDKKDEEEHEKYKDEIMIATCEDPRFQLEINSNELCMPSCSDLDTTVDYMKETDHDVLNMRQMVEGSLTSPDNGCSFESCTFLDNTGCSSQWWDF